MLRRMLLSQLVHNFSPSVLSARAFLPAAMHSVPSACGAVASEHQSLLCATNHLAPPSCVCSQLPADKQQSMVRQCPRCSETGPPLTP